MADQKACARHAKTVICNSNSVRVFVRVDMSDDSATSYVPYVLEFENRPGYFYIHVTCGHPDLRTSRKMAGEASEELEKSGHEKVLALLDVEVPLSFADKFWLISGLPELGLENRTVAVVDTNPGHVPLNRFADAAANFFDIERHGFTSIEEAERWLASN